ncbi:MAG: hypothetical protein MJY88_09590 [Bacteroidales bacterium]|nr:hypothetical protein [Bacteroidales bacterium]
MSTLLGIHRPRTKYLDVRKANLTYRKQRKHTKVQTRKMTRRLLDLLGKILKEMKDVVRQELARVRATEMEGSFGTQKEHYDLRRVKARTKKTEILYIFFGIHTANVVQLADRIEKRALSAAA